MSTLFINCFIRESRKFLGSYQVVVNRQVTDGSETKDEQEIIDCHNYRTACSICDRIEDAEQK